MRGDRSGVVIQCKCTDVIITITSVTASFKSLVKGFPLTGWEMLDFFNIHIIPTEFNSKAEGISILVSSHPQEMHNKRNIKTN